jgi:hypothetical protein
MATAISMVALGTAPVVLATSASATGTHFVSITSAPGNVNEGDRMRLGTKVASAGSATRVQLQERQVDIYGNSSWVTVRSEKVRGLARHTFTVTADGINRERYRARAVYRSGKAAVSNSVSVTVWRWVPLGNYNAYYSTYGVSSNPYSNFAMNGRQYLGWYTYSSYRSWEARYTPGRSCKAFRGELGVRDESGDGSSAAITLLTDDDQVLYQSQSLEPGAVTKINLAMARPYRFIIRAVDTSPGGMHAYPAIGDPAYLCTGV